MHQSCNKSQRRPLLPPHSTNQVSICNRATKIPQNVHRCARWRSEKVSLTHSVILTTTNQEMLALLKNTTYLTQGAPSISNCVHSLGKLCPWWPLLASWLVLVKQQQQQQGNQGEESKEGGDGQLKQVEESLQGLHWESIQYTGDQTKGHYLQAIFCI